MSKGENVTLASNVLGTIGTILWCIQLIPQIWYNWRRKKTDGFPAAMMFLWASCEPAILSPQRWMETLMIHLWQALFPWVYT